MKLLSFSITDYDYTVRYFVDAARPPFLPTISINPFSLSLSSFVCSIILRTSLPILSAYVICAPPRRTTERAGVAAAVARTATAAAP